MIFRFFSRRFCISILWLPPACTSPTIVSGPAELIHSLVPQSTVSDIWYQSTPENYWIAYALMCCPSNRIRGGLMSSMRTMACESEVSSSLKRRSHVFILYDLAFCRKYLTQHSPIWSVLSFSSPWRLMFILLSLYEQITLLTIPALPLLKNVYLIIEALQSGELFHYIPVIPV